jgi:Protein of unknown function (DUF1643).
MELLKSIGTLTTTLITDKDMTHCFEIERTLNEASGDKAIMISLFPTLGSRVGDAFVVDKTTHHLVSHMAELNFKSIKIVNLFSKICRGSRLSTRNLEVDIENLEYIEAIFKRKDFHEYKVILAWGSSMNSSKSCKEMKRTLINLFQMYSPHGKLYQLTTNNLASNNQEAIHPLFLGINYSNSKWMLSEYQIKTEYLNDKEELKKPDMKGNQVQQRKKASKNVS